jgi:hypothetical protein
LILLRQREVMVAIHLHGRSAAANEPNGAFEKMGDPGCRYFLTTLTFY